MGRIIPRTGLAADVASLREYELDLLPEPVTAVGAAVPARPADIEALAAPRLASVLDPVVEIDDVLAGLDGPGRVLGTVEQLLTTEARACAVESRQRLHAGSARPLEGLAFGVKDVVQVAGSPTTFGSPAYAGFLPAVTAQVVENLLNAGAILVAKLATYEFASGPNSRTRNPWDSTRRSGGSSSGSAAAVGAGLLPLALGTDSGGSIRVPAAWCGAVGFKPTRGRVPTKGIPPLSWHLDHAGTLTRTAQTAAAVFGFVTGESRRTGQQPEPRARGKAADVEARPLSGLRVGVLRGWFRVTEPEVDELTSSAAEILADLGADLVPLELPILDRINPDAVKRVIVDAESAALHDPHRAGYGDTFRSMLSSGADVRAVDYIHALRLRVILAEAVDRLFDDVDVLVCATSPIVAPPEGQDIVLLGGEEMALIDVVARNTSVFNMSGHPALTLPSGLARSTGMPVGLQIIAPHWQDELCLRIGIAVEDRVQPLPLPAFHR